MSDTASGQSKTRRLVICCDGTWNSAEAGGSATNVVRMARAVKTVSDNGVTQIVYYHPGVGTGNGIDRLIGGGTGVGLSRNVRDAYAFIVNNYQPGDEIFLFGFSRGAYTARSIAGMIGVIGLLQERQMGAFLDAWAYFKLPQKQRDQHEQEFARRFRGRQTDVPIKCIGVWDTVGSLGIPTAGLLGMLHPCRSAYQFLSVKLGAHVEHAFHALAIDEKRGAFGAAVWEPADNPVKGQVVRQVWFSGVHSDCGGGYPMHGASDVAFVWMAAQVAELLDLDEDHIRSELDQREALNTAELHETMNAKWRLLGPVNHRPIGKGMNEKVHASVIARLATNGYTPARAAALRDLPTAELSDYEKQFAWKDTIKWDAPAPFITAREAFCDRIVRWLGGG